MVGGMRPLGNAQQLERRRLKAVALLNSGHGYHAVAKKLKASISSLVRWIQAYRRGGRKELKPRPTPGRPPRLRLKQKERLVRVLLDGAVAAGFPNEMWTLSRVSQEIQKLYGVKYHPGHVWRLLTNMGLSCQKPERRATQQDKKSIERWKRIQWPRIKKRPAATSASGFPR